MIPEAPAIQPLARSFFARDAVTVARELLGHRLVSTIGGVHVEGRIIETEAYTGPEDEASHAAARIGRTRRNETMFGAAGCAYVYRIYGLHWCVNAVTGDVGFPAAVLLRAVEPLVGLDTMRARRAARLGSARDAGVRDLDLARGPARLAQAFGISGELNGRSLQQPPLILAHGDPIEALLVEATPRVGVTRAGDLPLRFVIAGSPWLSR